MKSEQNILARNQIILAALLHDIGKFWQRADQKLNDSPNIDNPSQEWKWLVPYTQYDRPGYQHAIWTYQFLEDQKAIFHDIGLWQVGDEKLSNLSAKHHRPDTDLQAIIQLADWWSSGIDRTQIGSEEEESPVPLQCYEDWGRFSFKNIPLHSIFDILQTGNTNAETRGCHAYPLKPLSLDRKDIFPFEISKEKVEDIRSNSLQSDYKELWSGFVHEFRLLPRGNAGAFIFSLMYLLKKYTWCIPSSTVDLPNVSLFEHLKTTAAIAGSLYEYKESMPDSFVLSQNRLELKQGHDPLRMCCVDLSGIQRFIYDVASKKAYKSLKGRSFYLQLLLDNIIHHVFKQLDQTSANLIYSSGGKAYFLIPNTEQVNCLLMDSVSEIEKMLWDEHRGRIFAAFGSISFRYVFRPGEKSKIASEEASIKNLGDLWKTVSDRSGQEKTRRFKKLLVERFNMFFDESSPANALSQYPDVCAVTGEPFDRDKEGKAVYEDIGEGPHHTDEEQQIRVLPSVYEQVELGKALKECQLLCTYPNNGDQDFRRGGNSIGATMAFGDLKLQTILFKSNVEEVSLRRLSSLTESCFFSLNRTDFLWNGSSSGNQAGHGFLFYGGNSQPNIADRLGGESRPKMLEEICWVDENLPIADENAPYSKLGILRMDVDNLGQLFINGFKDKNKSFAAYGTLSFQLDLFFSGFLNTIREKETYRNSVAILYSGGDDVFAIGRWDKVVGFALEVREHFQEFVGRPDISISAGIAIVDRKYPIYKAADAAGEAEGAAKKFLDQNLGAKNAITFFGQTVSWNKEFEEVERIKNSMVALCSGQGLSRGLLHQLQRYKAFKDDSERNFQERNEPRDFSYKWHSAYYLKRLGDRYEKKKEILQLIEELKDRILHDAIFGADRFLDLVALAARWSEHVMRLKSKLSS